MSLRHSNSDQPKWTPIVKCEPEDVTMADQSEQIPTPRLYPAYASARDIQYTPESALNVGLGMAKEIQETIQELELGSKLRQEVWIHEVESLQKHGSLTTLIAVCGATGAGKSSLLNAILDDNIVPTSGMRACTSVVTEVSYHKKKGIEADICFLSKSEWKDELRVLLQDLVDEEGKPKRIADLNSEEGIAWEKVHALYPEIELNQLVGMTVDQIIATNPDVAMLLGTTEKIVALDSETFAKEIAKYVASNDRNQYQSTNDDDDDELDMLAVEFHAITEKDTNGKSDDGSVPSLWPLIRQVRVRCHSAALSTGVVLVDLPGVADANAVRNNIAKAYMKKCDCVWILAPVTRAVDDKTARDLLGEAFKTQLMNGNYHHKCITFIASKCDDISCTEVIRDLRLTRDPELQEIERRIRRYGVEIKRAVKEKLRVERNIARANEVLNAGSATIAGLKARIATSENDESEEKCSHGTTLALASQSNTKRKRRYSGSQMQESPKKMKNVTSIDGGGGDEGNADDSQISGGSSDEVESNIKGDHVNSVASDAEAYLSNIKANTSVSFYHDDFDPDEIKAETIETVEKRRAESQRTIQDTHELLAIRQKDLKETIDTLAILEKNQLSAQREKNALCSLKRSEYSRKALQTDFRVGLKDLDDEAAEKRDPANFDPSQNLRDYETIDLPVFMCSARDYVRQTGQVKGDGQPTCFSNVEDTGIPGVQKWCHSLSIDARERSALHLLNHLKTFAKSIQTYVEGIGDVTHADRKILRQKWESPVTGVEEKRGKRSHSSRKGGGSKSDNVNRQIASYVEPIGVTARLVKDFGKVVDDSVKELQTRFNNSLEDRCRKGAAKAAKAAVKTSDSFAASMRWNTYRATLRRHGSWRQDLNVKLLSPFSRSIATSWAKVFETDLFASFRTAAVAVIIRFLKEVEDSAPAGLKDRTKVQTGACREETALALSKTIDVVQASVKSEQKEISRCLAPHVMSQLADGYDQTTAIRGIGSVAGQKTFFHDYIDNHKNTVFDGSADILLERLSKATESIGSDLNKTLEAVAKKIEVTLSVLWEAHREDPAQAKNRSDVVETVTNVLVQVQHWIEAEQLRMRCNED